MNTLWAIYISEQRLKKTYKRNQLAELCKVDPSYITLIERDGYVPNNEIIESISKALECDVDKSLIIAGYAPKTVSVSECMHILNMNGETFLYNSMDHQLINVLRSINNLPAAKKKNAIQMINTLIENSIKILQKENNKVSHDKQNIETNDKEANSEIQAIPLSETSKTNTSSQKKLIDDNPLLFYKCTSSRVVPTKLIIEHVESYFKDIQYSEVAIEELYQYLRLKLDIPSVNRANLRVLFKRDETLDYEHFLYIASKINEKQEEIGIKEAFASESKKDALPNLTEASIDIKKLITYDELDPSNLNKLQKAHIDYVSEIKKVLGKDFCSELIEDNLKIEYCLSAARLIVSKLNQYTKWRDDLLCLQKNTNLFKLKVLPLLYAYTDNDSIISVISTIFQNDKIKYVEQLTDLSIFDLEDNIKIFLSEFVKWIAVDQTESFNIEWSNLFKRDRYTFIIKKRAEGLTLDLIGRELNITRERVRQLESKFFYLLDKLLIKYKIPYLILSQTESDYFITIDDINFFVDDHSDVLTYCLKNISYKDIRWDQEINGFIIGESEWFYNLIKYIEKDLTDLIPKEMFKQHIEELYDYCNHKIDRNLINTILQNHYTLQGEIYTKHKISKSQMYKEVLKYYPDGICIYDNKTIDIFRKLVKDAFGDIELSDNDRALQARIADVAVLCGRGKYILPEYINIDEELLHKIYLYIVKNNRSSIMFMEIFNKFKTPLQAAKIDNHYFLQGILKYKYNNSFTFAKDYLIINNETETNIKDEIEDFIKKQKTIVAIVLPV